MIRSAFTLAQYSAHAAYQAGEIWRPERSAPPAKFLCSSDVSCLGLDVEEAPSNRRLTVFFLPLALQAASQSLSYPLVAMVAAHGEGGALNLAGVAQSNIIMFMVGTLGAGLVTAGMVFARTRKASRTSSPSTTCSRSRPR